MTAVEEIVHDLISGFFEPVLVILVGPKNELDGIASRHCPFPFSSSQIL